MEVGYIPMSNPQSFLEAVNPMVIGENNLQQTPVTMEQIDRVYHLLQLQALRIDELENRIRTLEGRNE